MFGKLLVSFVCLRMEQVIGSNIKIISNKLKLSTTRELSLI